MKSITVFGLLGTATVMAACSGTSSPADSVPENQLVAPSQSTAQYESFVANADGSFTLLDGTASPTNFLVAAPSGSTSQIIISRAGETVILAGTQGSGLASVTTQGGGGSINTTVSWNDLASVLNSANETAMLGDVGGFVAAQGCTCSATPSQTVQSSANFRAEDKSIGQIMSCVSLALGASCSGVWASFALAACITAIAGTAGSGGTGAPVTVPVIVAACGGFMWATGSTAAAIWGVYENCKE